MAVSKNVTVIPAKKHAGKSKDEENQPTYKGTPTGCWQEYLRMNTRLMDKTPKALK